MFQKKGVSPLIATVLLLAFAVALATVIINLDPFGMCNLKNTEISKINDNQRVCYNNKTQEIELFITNGDKKNIIGFQIKASGEKNTLNIEDAEIMINQNEEKKLSIEFPFENYGKPVGLELHPWINSSNRRIKCNLNEEVFAIPDCP
jgi:flagellin-like protein